MSWETPGCRGWGKEFEAKRRALSTLFRPNAKVGEKWDARPAGPRCSHATIAAMYGVIFRIGIAACAALPAPGALAQACDYARWAAVIKKNNITAE